MLLLLFLVQSLASSSTVDRAVQFVNESGGTVDVYWIDGTTRRAVPIGTAPPGASSFPVNTFVCHEFELREVCTEGSVCRSAHHVASKRSKMDTDNDAMTEIIKSMDEATASPDAADNQSSSDYSRRIRC